MDKDDFESLKRGLAQVDDLVEQLEKRANTYSWDSVTFYISDANMMRQAAAEIRSLRAQVAQERAGIVVMVRAKSEAITELVANDGKVTDARAAAQLALDALADAIEAQQDKEPQT